MAGKNTREGPRHNGSRKTGWALGSVAALIIAVLAAWFGFSSDSDGDSGNPATGAVSRTAAGQSADAEAELCALDLLPREADDVVGDIQSGGPFEHPDNDGTHFGNYEGLLPEEHGDFYLEYTVATPGLDHRGARRIVTGGGTETDPADWYYTDDHYESFCEIPDAE